MADSSIDLQDIVADSSERLAALMRQVELVDGRLEHTEAEVAETAAQLHEHTAQLGERASALEVRITHSHTVLEELQGKLRGDLDEIIKQVETSQSDCEKNVAECLHQLAHFDATTEELKAKLATARETTLERHSGLRDSLEDTIQTYEEVFGHSVEQVELLAVGRVRACQDAIETRTAQLQAVILNEYVPAIKDQIDTFVDHLGSILERLQQLLDRVRQGTEQGMVQTLTQDALNHEENLLRLIERVNNLDLSVSSLAANITNSGDDLALVKNTIIDGMETTNIGLSSIVGLIQETYEFFSRFGGD